MMPSGRRLAHAFVFLLTLASSLAAKAAAGPGISIVPRPASVKPLPGEFTLNGNLSVQAPAGNADIAGTVQWFASKIQASTGLQEKSGGGKAIAIHLNARPDTALGEEGYRLKVTTGGITVTANRAAGVFYALQSLLQLLPPDVESPTVNKGVAWTIPCVEIADKPRFGWRGLMLDVSRHFFNKAEVMRYIDEMARYKLNTLHWHLADDEGWRIEIKSLPELTRTGAWRVNRTGRWGTFVPPLAGEKADYGGYYTQDDVREILQYAKSRFVTVLPEIDVPAHSLALIASYPNLSCTQLPYFVNNGRKFYTREDNVLCVGNDSVFSLLDKIFTEIAALFPHPYIHVGGDEAYKGFWTNCPKCKKRMADEHLKTPEELQSYFERRLETMLKSKGKKLIGWDEILEGGLTPEATVMSWRGMSGGIAAAKMKHEVVMTPWDYCYLDLYQGEPDAEPPTYGLCRLTDSYHYEPVPDSVEEKYILGGQGNLWAESVPTFRHAEYMTWPRGIALAEVYWSPKAARDWDDFVSRLETQFPRLDAAGVKYATSLYNAECKSIRKGEYDFTVQLSTEIKGLDIYYTFDNTNPDAYSSKYAGKPIEFPEGATNLNLITYRNGKPIGRQISVSKETLAGRVDEKHHEY